MKINRVLAIYREGVHPNPNYKLIILCGINESKQLENGEWFGYYQGDGATYPFILRDGKTFFYGGEEHYSESTNIGCKTIKSGELFTVFSSDGDAIYEITSCHPY